MDEIFGILTEYTLALKAGLDSTSQANERPLITRHLVAAAEIYALLHSTGNLESVQELVKSEVRAHGWSFISGQTGDTIAKKWVEFTNAVGVRQ
ncbi:hypothetical protein [Marinobacterium zhoushanense]|nr:hypothetical protein [Marinobacterium zhoushanense]